MSQSKYAGWGARTIDDVERRVRTYLADKARNGAIYVKTGRVAEDLELGPERAGQAIAKLDAECRTLEIDRWSTGRSSGGTTWHVSNIGPTPFGRGCTDCARLVPEAAEDCPYCGRRLGR